MDDYLELLNRYDEGVEQLDMPADRSIHVGLTEDIKRLQTVLREERGLECHMGIDFDGIRAWYGGLDILKDAQGNPCPDGYHSTHSSAVLNIRVSNFGRLTTTFGCTEKALHTYPVEQIREYITEPSFRYIPIDVLLTPYSGVYTTLNRSSRTYRWFDRFFFYPN